MYKYLPTLSVFLILITASPFLLSPATADTRCLNYWVHPVTGKEECLNLPVTKQPVIDAEKPAYPPAGFEFLTESETGEDIFIKVSQVRRVDGVLKSFPTVVTRNLNGKMYDTRYQIDCDRRILLISSISHSLLNNSSPIVVSEPGTLGYLIWDRSCTNIQSPTSTANPTELRLVPSRCREYRVRIGDKDFVDPQRLNPYWSGRVGNLSTLKPKEIGLNRVFGNSQNFKPKNHNYNPVQPQIESNFQDNYQTSDGYQWRSCQHDYRY